MARTSFTLNSVDYGDDTHRVHVRSHLPVPSFRVNVSELAQGNGVVTQGSTYGALRWKLRCSLVAHNATDFAAAWDAVYNALVAAHVAGETVFTPGWYPATVSWYARPVGGPVIMEQSINAVEFDLEILASDPSPIEE